MFKSKFLSLGLGLFMGSAAWAQINKTIPAWVDPVAAADFSVIPSSEIKDGYCYLLIDEQYNTATQQAYFHYSMKAVSEAALDQVSQIEIGYDPSYQKVAVHAVKIHREGQVIDKTNTAPFRKLTDESRRRDGILTGRETLYRNLEDIRKGDILEYSYTLQGRNPIYKDNFSGVLGLSYSVPVGKIYYTTISRVELFYKNGNTTLQSVESEKGGLKKRVWQTGYVPAISSEANLPSWLNIYAHVETSSFKNWKDVRTWALELFKEKPYSRTELKAVVSAILRDHPKDIEAQITAMVDFVQKEIRYSGNEYGIYTHVPHTPEFVLKNRFGDCKDKSVLLCALLKEIDVDAFPVLVSTSDGAHIEDHLASPKYFDHCIAAIYYDNDYYYIDGTKSYQKGSFLNRGNGGFGKGMLLVESGAPFLKIPDDEYTNTSVSEEFMINDNGDASLTVYTEYWGNDAEATRYYFAINSQGDLEKEYKTYYSKYCKSIELTHPIDYTEREDGCVVVKESYLLKGFWTKDKEEKENKIEKSFIPYSLNSRIVYVDEETRKYPLALNFPGRISYYIRVAKAGGWNVKPDKVNVENLFFHYSNKTSVTNGILLLEHEYTAKAPEVSPDDYALYKSEVDIVSQNIVFTGQQATTSDGGSIENHFNWPLLFILMLGVPGLIVLCVLLSLKKKVTPYENEYEQIGGWLVVLAIGLCLQPIFRLYNMITVWQPNLSTNYFSYFFSKENSLYDPFRGFYVTLHSLYAPFMLISSIVLIFLFFKRRNNFRFYFAWFLGISVGMEIIDTFINGVTYSKENSAEEISEQFMVMIRSILYASIWMPYVLLSERSKHTFTVGNPEPVPVTPSPVPPPVSVPTNDPGPDANKEELPPVDPV